MKYIHNIDPMMRKGSAWRLMTKPSAATTGFTCGFSLSKFCCKDMRKLHLLIEEVDEGHLFRRSRPFARGPYTLEVPAVAWLLNWLPVQKELELRGAS